MRNLLLAVVVTLLMLMTVEGVLRLTYRGPWYARIEADQKEAELAAYTRNVWGLRDRDYGPKRPGTKRVMILGDSFTFGSGVMDDEAVFPRILERKLGVEILNGGLPGSFTSDWLALYRSRAAEFDPDVLVVVFFLRDGTRMWSKGMFDATRLGLAREHEQSSLYRWSYAYRVFQDQQDRHALATRYAADFQAAYFGPPERTAEWERAQHNLATLAAEARVRGLPLGLVVYPVLVDLDAEPYPFQGICDAVEAVGRAHGMRTFSLLPAFRDESAPALWVHATDQHPNARAHAIAAEALGPFVQRLLDSGQ